MDRLQQRTPSCHLAFKTSRQKEKKRKSSVQFKVVATGSEKPPNAFRAVCNTFPNVALWSRSSGALAGRDPMFPDPPPTHTHTHTHLTPPPLPPPPPHPIQWSSLATFRALTVAGKMRLECSLYDRKSS